MPAAPATSTFKPPAFYNELLANPGKPITLVDNPGTEYDITGTSRESRRDAGGYRIELSMDPSTSRRVEPNLSSNFQPKGKGSLIFHVKTPGEWNDVGNTIAAWNKALKTEMAIENRQTNARGH